MTAFKIPERLIQAGERRHQHRAAAVETAAIGHLPYVLDRARVGPNEAVAEGFEYPRYRFGMPFQACLAPAKIAVFGLDPDEQPARRYVKRLYPPNFHF